MSRRNFLDLDRTEQLEQRRMLAATPLSFGSESPFDAVIYDSSSGQLTFELSAPKAEVAQVDGLQIDGEIQRLSLSQLGREGGSASFNVGQLDLTASTQLVFTSEPRGGSVLFDLTTSPVASGQPSVADAVTDTVPTPVPPQPASETPTVDLPTESEPALTSPDSPSFGTLGNSKSGVNSVLTQSQFEAARANGVTVQNTTDNSAFLNTTDDWQYFTVGNDVGNVDNVFQLGSKTIVEIPEGVKLTGRLDSNVGTDGLLIFGGGEIFDSAPESQVGGKKPTVGLQSAKNATVRGYGNGQRLTVTAENQFGVTIGNNSEIADVNVNAFGKNGDGIALNGSNSQAVRTDIQASDNAVKLNGSNLLAEDINIQQTPNGTPIAISGFLNQAGGGLVENITVKDVTVTGSGNDIQSPAFDAVNGANEGIVGIETPGSFGGQNQGGNKSTFARNVNISGLEVFNTDRPLVQILNGRPEGDTNVTRVQEFRQENGNPTIVEDFNISYTRDGNAPDVASVVQGPDSNLDEVKINGQTARELGIESVSAVNQSGESGGRFV